MTATLNKSTMKEWTASTLSVEIGIDAPSIQRQANRMDKQERFKEDDLSVSSADDTLHPEVANYYLKKYADTKVRKGRPDRTPSNTSKAKTKARPSLWRRLKLDLLDFNNIIEMGLVVYGLTILYQWAGVFLATMVCITLWKAQMTAKNPKLRDANERSIEVVKWMSIASFFLHFITFWNAWPIEIPVEATANGKELQEVVWWTAKVAAAFIPATFVSALSFNSVLTTYKLHRQK
ncbi:MAG: hypothetical protein AAFP77_29475 [Bacteroidota bacterium]